MTNEPESAWGHQRRPFGVRSMLLLSILTGLPILLMLMQLYVFAFIALFIASLFALVIGVIRRGRAAKGYLFAAVLYAGAVTGLFTIVDPWSILVYFGFAICFVCPFVGILGGFITASFLRGVDTWSTVGFVGWMISAGLACMGVNTQASASVDV